MCNCLCSVIVLCGMMMKGREKVKPDAGSQPALLEKHQGGTKFNVPIRRTNRYQQYYIPSQHIQAYCGRVWNLIQVCNVQSSGQKMYISTPPSPEVENFQMKIQYPAGDRTPDLLNQRQTCYHLSQRGELLRKSRGDLKIVTYRVFGNSYYKFIGLVEGTEQIGTLVRNRTVFVLQIQQFQSKRLVIVIYLFMTPLYYIYTNQYSLISLVCVETLK